MGLFDIIFGEKKSGVDKNQEQKDKIQNVLDENLKKLGFTNLEIKEVMDIVTITEANIQIAKDSLAFTNADDSNTLPMMEKVKEEISQLQVEMAADIKKKVQEIQKRKVDFRKEL